MAGIALPEIERLLAAFNDPAIVELIVNDDGAVYLERSNAVLEKVGFKAGPADVAALLKALVGEEAFGPRRPYADLSAADGSRIHVLSSPIVRGGLAVTIRKRPRHRPSLDEMTQGGGLTPACAGFLKFAVAHRKNILVVGGASSGKTTMLSGLCAMIDAGDRILVLEDTPELALPQSHVVYMKTVIGDAQGAAGATMRDLVKNTLRMRPDRIIVGEVRGSEALDMLQAMNVGQEGVMATLHAGSCREGLQRLETLVLMAGFDMPLKAVRGNVAVAIDLIVFMGRLSDGSRRVVQVSEITGLEVENILLSDLFTMESRKSPEGLTFALRPTGSLPRFFDQLRQQGFALPLEFFKKE